MLVLDKKVLLRSKTFAIKSSKLANIVVSWLNQLTNVVIWSGFFPSVTAGM
jgi:hypothetical protein